MMKEIMLKECNQLVYAFSHNKKKKLIRHTNISKKKKTKFTIDHDINTSNQFYDERK